MQSKQRKNEGKHKCTAFTRREQEREKREKKKVECMDVGVQQTKGTAFLFNGIQWICVPSGTPVTTTHCEYQSVKLDLFTPVVQLLYLSPFSLSLSTFLTHALSRRFSS
eukprot:gene10010-6989_t